MLLYFVCKADRKCRALAKEVGGGATSVDSMIAQAMLLLDDMLGRQRDTMSKWSQEVNLKIPLRDRCVAHTFSVFPFHDFEVRGFFIYMLTSLVPCLAYYHGFHNCGIADGPGACTDIGVDTGTGFAINS